MVQSPLHPRLLQQVSPVLEGKQLLADGMWQREEGCHDPDDSNIDDPLGDGDPRLQGMHDDLEGKRRVSPAEADSRRETRWQGSQVT